MQFRTIEEDDHETLNILEHVFLSLKNMVECGKNSVEFWMESRIVVLTKAGKSTTLLVIGYLDVKTPDGTAFTVFLGNKQGKIVTFSDQTALYGVLDPL